MNTDVAPRLGWWQQTWRLGAAAAVGIPLWLSIGVLLRGQTDETGSWFVIGDPLVAFGCLTALLWRRRFPLAVAMTVVIASTASALASGAAFLALVSISTRRRPVEIGVVALALVTASQFAGGFYPVQSSPGLLWYQLALPALIAGIAVAMGMAIGGGASKCGPCETGRRARNVSRPHERRRHVPWSGTGSPARCTTYSHTGSPWSPCRPECWTTAATSPRRKAACWSAVSPTAPTRHWKNYGMSSVCSGPTRAARNHPSPPSTAYPN